MSDAEASLLVAIVVPVYNEEEAIGPFHDSLVQVLESLPHRFHILYINDGSTDRTQAILEHLADTDARITVVELSRNFGHQAALSAGLDLADGQVVITMDGDGQHPPALIPQMLETYRQGYDVVLMQRTGHEAASAFKRWSASIFYWIISRLSNVPILPDVADFRLMSAGVVQALRRMPEYHRFLRGMIAWAGFRTTVIPYRLAKRLGGKPKYTLKKMSRLALEAIFSFSLLPLWFNILSSLCLFLLAVLQAIAILAGSLAGIPSGANRGWEISTLALLLTGGMIMLGLSLIGGYVGYIFQETKRRPVYLIRSIKTTSPVVQEKWHDMQ